MATPSNPGWVTGFVPNSAQWAAAFSAKVDYPGPIAQGGTGAQTAQGAAYNITQRQVVASTPVTMQPLTFYAVRTSVGAFSLYLPPLAGLTLSDWIDVADIDFDANVNNITVHASGSDVIALYGTTAGTQVLNLAGVQARFVVNNSSWRMLV